MTEDEPTTATDEEETGAPAADRVLWANRELPWMTRGTQVQGAMSVSEAIERAGLDYTVVKRPVYTTNGKGNKIKIPNRYATVREDTDQFFGVVGSTYQVHQYADSLAFVDEVLGFGAEFESVGTMIGHKQMFAVAKMPQHIEIAGVDEVAMYALFRTAHDGTKGVSIDLTPVNIRCTNAIGYARKKSLRRWTARHVSTLEVKLEEAARTLNLTDRYAVELTETSNRLAAIELDLAMFRADLMEVLPGNDARRELITDRIVANIDASDSIAEGLRHTAWGGLNAVTEILDWGLARRSTDSRMYNTVDGLNSRVRETMALRMLRRAG